MLANAHPQISIPVYHGTPAEHTEMGHKSLKIRSCSRPCCYNAVNGGGASSTMAGPAPTPGTMERSEHCPASFRFAICIGVCVAMTSRGRGGRGGVHGGRGAKGGRGGGAVAGTKQKHMEENDENGEEGDADAVYRTLRVQINPANLLDTDPYPSSSTEDFFDIVPAHLAHHNNLSPHSAFSPDLSSLFNTPPTPVDSPSPQLIPSMATPTPMPARGDRNAPQFDSSKPHELRRYFTDLEFLLDRAAVTDSTDRKKHATRFLSVEDQETWEALPSFQEARNSYAEFKADVLKLYAGNDEERRFELSDMDALIGHYSRVGILSLEDLTTFYRKFLRITTYLISKKRLSEVEQSRSFLRAMQPASFSVDVKLRLQIKKPDVRPADPYALADIYEAAEFVLSGSGSSLFGAAASTPISAPAPATVEVKPDPGIAALVGTMAELVKVLAAQKVSGESSSSSTTPRRPRPDGCGYCSETTHYIGDCEHVLEDIRAGKCRRNTEGRVVLPTGAFVPRTINGKDLRARIEKWHEQNPGQLSAAQLMVEIAAEHPSSTFPTSRTAGVYTLTEEHRLQMLHHEINALQTRAQVRRALAHKNSDEGPDRAIPPPAPMPPAPPAAAPVIQPAANGPQHPFAKANDAAYAPPKDRNLGLPAAGPAKPAPAYRSTAPIYNEKDAAEVFNAVLDAPCSLTTRQVLSISPDVRSHMREVTTSRRAPAKDTKNPGVPAAQLLHNIDPALPFSDGSAPEFEYNTLEEQRTEDAHHTALIDSLPTAYTKSVQFDLPEGGVVVPDPYEVYYNTGSIPEDLIVSMESSAIRSILPIIDNQQQVESIVDGGSQIIAMSEAVCHELALSYDPRIILRMQSANGAITPSLGLARNVPFRVGDITLYLQVHVIRNPAYDVLLGRPFDVLTQSIVRNFANEDQTITICDPNSGKLATVPTVPRGPPRHRPQGFQNSRI
ncbi:hypothetical protein MVEN_01414100 [Mycena venus]|uniref:Uncharacterized protein n=1 Tax=Mycena venus TaxID=2733690 RepID=A0A8H6XZ50_9AGAR|nr:hypothetical protein MVEN_01414100 [Mycena venus]